MTGEECFGIWAPADASWSAWAKPVLFAQLPSLTGLTMEPPAGADVDALWAPDAGGRTALIVDLPGVLSLGHGLALARRGYRPVPLYNTTLTSGASVAVDAVPIARELVRGTQLLRSLTLRPDAPPAFLLDARRMAPDVPPKPGVFDNRWVVFPQDFPSGSRLRSAGIDTVLLVHGAGGLQDDLAHVLLRWRQLGLRLLATDVTGSSLTRELHVAPPSMFKRAWHRALTVAGLRRHNAGGFGAVVPIPSSGGHG